MATNSKAKLNPPKTKGDSNLALQVRPVIQMGAPQIKVPEIKIPEIKVTNDMQPIAQALIELAEYVKQLGMINAEIAQQQLAIMNTLAQQKEPKITVNPSVKIPPRPRDFYVELDKDGDETVGMRITAVSSH